MHISHTEYTKPVKREKEPKCTPGGHGVRHLSHHTASNNNSIKHVQSPHMYQRIFHTRLKPMTTASRHQHDSCKQTRRHRTATRPPRHIAKTGWLPQSPRRRRHDNIPQRRRHHDDKKLERWASNSFLVYIHEQIAALSANVSKLMSKQITFHNVHFNKT